MVGKTFYSETQLLIQQVQTFYYLISVIGGLRFVWRPWRLKYSTYASHQRISKVLTLLGTHWLFKNIRHFRYALGYFILRMRNIYILLDVLLCSIAEYFYELCRFFDEPVGRVKMQIKSKNSQRYYTTKRLIRDLLSNTPNCLFRNFNPIHRWRVARKPV